MLKIGKNLNPKRIQMKNFKLCVVLYGLLCLCSCGNQTQTNDAEMDRFISDLMAKMTIKEKLGQLNIPTGGDMVTGQVMSNDLEKMIRNQEIAGFFNVKGLDKIKKLQQIAVEETELKIPLIVGADIIHGYETIFPIPLALSCSWDTLAVEQMARVAAREASASGINWTYSPMVDICRDARWGRIAEGNGEDPYLGSLFAKAYVRGYQGDDMKENDEILACVKHFALYGASEAGRDYNTVDMSRVRMYNEYLAPYKAAVEAGVGSVMSAFNLVDGIPATANKWLLTDLLREQWGFNGFVVTDYNSINEMNTHGIAPLKEAAVQTLDAGTDMDMVSNGFNTLEESLREGKVSEEQIDMACRRVLEAKYKMGLFENPYKYCDEKRAETDVFTPENRETARGIATKTFVLLKNDQNILPLKKHGKIALIGPMANAGNNMCGMWSMTCRPEKHASLLEGFRKVIGDEGEILYAKGCNIYDDPVAEKNASGIRPIEHGDSKQLLAEALQVASRADIIVVALGECADMSGESASRTNLEMTEPQHLLMESLLATGKPVVLLLFTGRPMVLSWEQEHVPAILNVWFGGSEAADAIADVVFGKVSPSGRLTTTFPRNVGQIPLYYNHLNTSRPDGDSQVFNRYQSNYLDVPNTPLYPFGYGLSYTTFEYGKLSLSAEKLSKGGSIEAKITVTNKGDYDAYEVVQLYLRDIYAKISRPVKELKKFERVFLKKGESKEITFVLTDDDLKYYDSSLQYGYDPGEFDIMVGPNSANVQTLRFTAE